MLCVCAWQALAGLCAYTLVGVNLFLVESMETRGLQGGHEYEKAMALKLSVYKNYNLWVFIGKETLREQRNLNGTLFVRHRRHFSDSK